MIIHGDCLEKLKELKDNSIDAIITDPPYGLKFMGKNWDYDVPAVSMWVEALRVLKPGGHLLSFGGTRTYHRMVVNIEDAGFEIRDQIMWLYGVGFPKSLNVYKSAQKSGIVCDCGVDSQSEKDAKQTTKSQLRSMRKSDLSETFDLENKSGQVLQSSMSKQSASSTVLRSKSKKGSTSREESSVEGRRNVQKNQGKLHRSEVCSMSEGISGNVSKIRLRNGASSSDCAAFESTTDSNGSGSSYQSQHEGQSTGEFGIVAMQSQSQISRAWSTCSNCLKPIVDQGLGTALKPANEPIVLARKPLEKGLTIAQNVLKYGTGALNIDASRIEGAKPQTIQGGRSISGSQIGNNWEKEPRRVLSDNTQGRWPANLLLDEVAAEMLDEQSGFLHGAGNKGTKKAEGKTEKSVFGIGGGASRFFYVAKASKRERGTENNHPTVKPIKLMEYLIKLITPPDGTVLDPFAGSGSTGVACKKLGFNFIGIEREKEYVEIAEKRISAIEI